jgi:hypothetical protein
MAQTYEFTLDRAQKTRGAQDEIKARWTWSEKSLEQWDASIAALIAQNEARALKETAMLAKRGETDTALDQLNSWTGEGLTLMRLRLRNEAEKLATLSTLSANGTSRANKLKEALEWENAWSKIDATFAPTTENTFAAFQTLRKQCVKLVEEYGTAETKVTTENTKLILLKSQLEDDNQAWYKASTKVLKKGTAEGDLIRSRVPTTTGGPSPQPQTTLNNGTPAGNPNGGPATPVVTPAPVAPTV